MSAVAPLAEATVSEHEGVRYLHLGTPWVQGAMRLRQPNRLELEYVQRMMVWLLWFDPAAVKALQAVQLGLGAASITRFCHRVLGMRTTAVELNPSVIAACRHAFRLPADDERLHVVLADAARWVADPAHRGLAHVLNVDLYDHDAAAPVLDDDAFYAGCRDVLADGGVMTVNLFGRHHRFAASMARLEAVFGTGRVATVRPTREGNTVAVAVRPEARDRPQRHLAATRAAPWPARGEMRARAAAIEQRWHLPALKWLRLLRTWPPEA